MKRKRSYLRCLIQKNKNYFLYFITYISLLAIWFRQLDFIALWKSAITL